MLIHVPKGGEVIAVHPLTLAAHEALGWVQCEAPQAEPEPEPLKAKTPPWLGAETDEYVRRYGQNAALYAASAAAGRRVVGGTGSGSGAASSAGGGGGIFIAPRA